MPLRNLRPARLAVAMVVAACAAACSPPSPAAAQTLAERVAARPDGTVRFSFPAREGACGTGDGIGFRDPRGAGRRFTYFDDQRGSRGSGDRESQCVAGPLQVELTLRSGEVTAVRARAGEAPAGAPAGIVDLGQVPAQEAARLLLRVAAEGSAETETALLAAVLAAGELPASDLLRIGRDDAVARETRQQAVFWLAILGDRAAVRQLHRLVEDAGVDQSVRGHAIFALGQTQEAEDAAFLRELYPRLRTEELKEKAIFSLSQVKGQGSDRWLLQVAADRAESMKLREQAVFWLAETGVPTSELDALYARLDEEKLKEQVIFAYSRRSGPESAERLLRLARTEADQGLRGKAIFWLGQTAGREITRDLAGLAQDGGQNRGVQEQAVFALSQRAPDEGVPALIQIARTHRDPEIRRKALFWLGQSKDPRALDLFEEILRER